MIFYGDSLSAPPDDLTIPQLLLDQHHPLKPIRKVGNPWLVDDATGKAYGFEEIRARVQDYPIVIWGTHRLGAIITAANPTFGIEELVYQLSTTKAKVIITHPSSQSVALSAAQKVGISPSNILYLSGTSPLEPSVDSLVSASLLSPPSYSERKLHPGEGRTKLAFLSFSSGTTGKPKAVSIPHYAVISNMLMMAKFHRVADDQYEVPERRRFRPGDVAAVVLPLFHIYGLVVNLHWLLFSGLTLVLTAKFNYEQMLKNIVRYKITHLLLVPPQVVLFCKHPATKNYDLSHVRWAIVGAAPVSPELALQFEKVLPGAEIGQGYGLTETCTTVTMTPISQRIGTPGSAGQFLPGVRAKIVKPDGSLAGYDEPGELVVTGPNMTLGYANNPQATKETFVDGWVHTGDEALMKPNGDLYIEIFKVKGFQVAPAELEGHLLDHADVDDVGVIGIPDDFSGEVPMAFIALNAQAIKRVEEDPTEAIRIKQDLVKFVADAKVQYKWLAGGVEFIDQIPKNPSGKILRRLLRDRAKEILAQRKAGKAKL
ncbi:phenylacetyl-CoA ligase [Hysterangium stoloniferum]|nr:phenylacetyl-CoA ligase [Hysterangium stoloniferum]